MNASKIVPAARLADWQLRLKQEQKSASFGKASFAGRERSHERAEGNHRAPTTDGTGIKPALTVTLAGDVISGRQAGKT